MSDKIVNTDEYRAFIQDVKQRIQSSQIKAAVSVNRELLLLYWELAERIVAKQQEASWGDGFLAQMSRDLQEAFPGMKGFSVRNLKYMRQWFQFWSVAPTIGQQLVAQIPWGSGTLFNNLIGLFLRELVRYIHLNPVRVGMLEGLDGLRK